METYIALLRGINVGGNNKVSMSQLKAILENLGYQDVKTYINSGNIRFTTNQKACMTLQEEWHKLIREELGLEIDVCVVSGKELLEAEENVPDWWGMDSTCKHNAIFVLYPYSTEEIMKHVGEVKPEYEQIECFGQVIFWSAPIETFSRTRLSKVVSSAVYNRITIRNYNTFLKLIEMVKGAN
jgi:uncharacterized protein (DUF1697 family)